MASTFEQIPASGPSGLTPVGGAGTVATSNGAGGITWTNQLALGAGGFVSYGAAPASTGDTRYSQAFAVRSNDGGNKDVIVGAAGTLVFGNTGVGTTVTGASVTLNASAMNLVLSNGAAFNMFSSVDIGMGASPASGKKAITYQVNATGAAGITFGAETTSMLITRLTMIADTAVPVLAITGGAPFGTASTNKGAGNISLNVAAPIAGGLTGYVDVNAGLDVGFVSKAMAGANQTLTDAESLCNMIETTGNNGGSTRALTINAPPTNGQMRFVKNNCTNGGITVQFATGAATATIAIATGAIVRGDGTNAVIHMVTT